MYNTITHMRACPAHLTCICAPTGLLVEGVQGEFGVSGNVKVGNSKSLQLAGTIMFRLHLCNKQTWRKAILKNDIMNTSGQIEGSATQ